LVLLLPCALQGCPRGLGHGHRVGRGRLPRLGWNGHWAQPLQLLLLLLLLVLLRLLAAEGCQWLLLRREAQALR
jgi:hypothetical protein